MRVIPRSLTKAAAFKRCSSATHLFTLIELLVVVAIISVLAAMLLPAMGKAKAMANAAVCTNSMKQIMLAKIMYAEDNVMTFFDPLAVSVDLGPVNDITRMKWVVGYNEYLHGSGSVDGSYGDMKNFEDFDPIASKLWNGCPTQDRATKHGTYHYAVIDRSRTGTTNEMPTFGMRIARVTDPASAGILLPGYQGNWANGWTSSQRFYTADLFYDQRSGLDPAAGGFRHRNLMWNVGFLDGRVEAFQWQPKNRVRGVLANYGPDY